MIPNGSYVLLFLFISCLIKNMILVESEIILIRKSCNKYYELLRIFIFFFTRAKNNLHMINKIRELVLRERIYFRNIIFYTNNSKIFFSRPSRSASCFGVFPKRSDKATSALFSNRNLIISILPHAAAICNAVRLS